MTEKTPCLYQRLKVFTALQMYIDLIWVSWGIKPPQKYEKKYRQTDKVNHRKATPVKKESSWKSCIILHTTKRLPDGPI